MTNALHGFLSCVFITIPEQMFFIIIALRIMGRKEMLDLYNAKENLISILKIVIPPAVSLNILDYIIKTPSQINKSIILIMLYLLFIYILKNRSYIHYPKLYLKAFACFSISIMISVAIEIVTIPIVFKLAGKTYEEIKLNFYLILICSLSSRIIDIVILVYIFINKNNKFQINISDYIFNNRFFMRLTVSSIVGLTIFEAYVIKLVMYNNLLNIVKSIYEQLILVTFFTFLIPSLIIAMVYLCINYCIIIINSEKQSIRND
jgi:hypothetical protein